MGIRSIGIALLVAFSVALTPCQAAVTQSGLKNHYDAAQHFQQSGKMEQAATEYRAFIAEAAAELGRAYAHAGDYEKASRLFDESLASNPTQPALRIEYARAALAHRDFTRAKELGEEVLQASPQHATPQQMAKAHLALGRALMKLNQDKQARHELEAAVDLDPDFEDGYALAVVCLDMDDGKCADRVFSEMEKSFGDTAPLHLQFGRAYVQSDFPQKAVEEFSKTIAEDPHMPQAHYLLAAAYLASSQSGSMKHAQEALKAELRVSPKDFLTYAALGHLAVTQHHYSEAKPYLKRAIALNPDSPDAYLYLGQMYYEMRRSAEAEDALRKAIAHTRDPSRNRYQIQKAHYLLGRLLAKDGHHAEAQAEMQIVQKMMARTLEKDKSRFNGSGMGSVQISAEERPDKPADSKAARPVEAFRKQLAGPVADSYNNLGAMAASGKDYATALVSFQHAAEWNPELPGLDYNWGRAAFMSSHFAQAVPPLTRYLKAHPEDTGIRSVLGISLFMIKNYPAVVSTLDPLKSGISTVPQVEYVYAASLVKTGRASEGVPMLLAMEKKNPSIPDIHRSLGEAYAARGEADSERAEEEFAAAVRLNPKDAAAHYELGKLDLALGKVKPAIAELETAIRLEPDNSAAHAALATAYQRDSRPEDAKKELELSGQHPPQASGPR